MHTSLAHNAAMYGGLFAVFSAFSFGTNTPFSTVVHAAGGTAILVVLVRAACACLLSGVYCWTACSKSSPRPNGWLVVVLSALFFGQGALYIGSVKYISVSLAALLFFSWPLMVGLISLLSGKTRQRGKAALCFATAFAGLGLALGVNLYLLDVRGVALAVCGAACMAMYVLTAQRFVRENDNAVALNFSINGGIVLLSLAAVLYSGEFLLPNSGRAWLALAVLSLFYSLATLTQLFAIRYAGAALSAILFNLEPLVSIVLAVLFFNETLSLHLVLGGVLVLSALTLYTFTQSIAR